MREVLKSDYNVWKSDPVTKALVELIFTKREGVKEDLMNSMPAEMEFCRWCGYTQALKDVINLVMEDFPVLDEVKKDDN